jgi:16S rRNA (cytidine1402-2'-O)-methyltransferase
MLSYQDHNERSRIPQLLDMLNQGQNVALVSDAGMPGISDPGFRLVREAIAASIAIEALPGASSVLVALIASGMPTDKFYFGGFLPRTSSKRQKAFADVSGLPATLIFFESPHRLAAALADATHVFPDRAAVVARELTKLHQDIRRGSVVELSQNYGSKQVKGEIVLLIAGASK